ncbi:zinc-binding dehydrogenase [Nonomuraea dietziae]|uniref:zinc-binding dehydrogenase n=1 Tax=Nonomuraea dietziae TaxID=65515 RepID=UPI00341409C4
MSTKPATWAEQGPSPRRPERPAGEATPASTETAYSDRARRPAFPWPTSRSSCARSPPRRHTDRQDLQTLTELIETGKLTPITDRTHPLNQAPQALHHLRTGHASGKITPTV